MTNTLLLIADRSSSSVLSAQLSALKLRVKAARDLSCAETDSFDAVVVDLDVFPAHQLREALQNIAGLRDIPVVALIDPDVAADLDSFPNLTTVCKGMGLWKRLNSNLNDVLKLEPAKPKKREINRSPNITLHGKILVIDDDADISRGLALRLMPYGLEVDRASNGMEGFRQAVTYKPDVILCDFMMPEGLGSYVIGRLRDCDIQTPVIVISGAMQQNGFNCAPERLEDLGAQAVLPKPIDFPLLLAEIHKHVKFPNEPRYQCSGSFASKFRTARESPKEPAVMEPEIRAMYYP